MALNDGYIPYISKAKSLAAWYSRYYGCSISRVLNKTIESLLLRLPVQSVAQVGIHFECQDRFTFPDMTPGLSVSLRLYGADSGHFLCSPDVLPVKNNMLDCVLLMHGLNFHDNPHRLLREVNRVLTDDGFLIIVGFNPYSLLGSLKLFGQVCKRSPWECRFQSVGKLKDWLGLLDFDVHSVDTFSYTLPLWSERLCQRFEFYRKLTSLKGGSLGNIYCITARKRTIPLTRIPLFKQKQVLKFASPGFHPTTRLKSEDTIAA